MKRCSLTTRLKWMTTRSCIGGGVFWWRQKRKERKKRKVHGAFKKLGSSFWAKSGRIATDLEVEVEVEVLVDVVSEVELDLVKL